MATRIIAWLNKIVSKRLDKTLMEKYGYTKEEINTPWMRRQLIRKIENEILDLDKKITHGRLK